MSVSHCCHSATKAMKVHVDRGYGACQCTTRPSQRAPPSPVLLRAAGAVLPRRPAAPAVLPPVLHALPGPQHGLLQPPSVLPPAAPRSLTTGPMQTGSQTGRQARVLGCAHATCRPVLFAHIMAHWPTGRCSRYAARPFFGIATAAGCQQ